jgi:hypothetical protein
MPSLLGAMFANIFFYGGFSFTSGAIEALMHDSLSNAGRADDYVKVLSRAQSRGIVGNIILVIAASYTYRFDPRLPFMIGAVVGIGLIYSATRIIEVGLDTNKAQINLLASIKLFVTKKTWLLFVIFGLSAMLHRQATDYYDTAFLKLALKPEYFGFVYGAAGIAAAITSWYNHKLKDIAIGYVAMLDFSVLGIWGIATGCTHNLYVAIAGMVYGLVVFRSRGILVQNWFIKYFNVRSRKATLISSINFFGQMFGLIMPLLIASFLASGDFFGRIRIFGFVILGFAIISPILLAKYKN